MDILGILNVKEVSDSIVVRVKPPVTFAEFFRDIDGEQDGYTPMQPVPHTSPPATAANTALVPA